MRQRWHSFLGRFCQAVARPQGKMGNSSWKECAQNQTQKSSLLPGLNVGWRDLGGLALTLALENTSILHTDEGSDASGRIII
jgi:hypothetical protein